MARETHWKPSREGMIAAFDEFALRLESYGRNHGWTNSEIDKRLAACVARLDIELQFYGYAKERVEWWKKEIAS